MAEDNVVKPAVILIVEDEPSQALTLKAILSQEGHNVLLSTTAEEALNLSLTELPDIILVDVHLTDYSGIDLVSNIHSHDELNHCIIVLMSYDDSEETTLAGLKTSADEFLYKPIRTEELKLKVKKWLERENLRKKIGDVSKSMNRNAQRLAAYFGDDLVQRLLDDNTEHDFLKGESITASILFLDIRNFTSFSESVEPHQVADLLNLFFTDVMDLVFKYNGSVNKLMGDAILATFGCPMTAPNDTENSVKCALAIRETIKHFNVIRPAYMKEDLRIGMGIARGKVFAGNVGSYRRMEYAVIGDTVNTAARLQELTKKASVDFFIDGTTYNELQEFLKVRKAHLNKLRGKKKETEIYYVENYIEEQLNKDEEEVTFF